MTFRDVLRSGGFQAMATGFVVMLIGLFFLALEFSFIGKVLASIGMLLGFIGLAMHTSMVLSQFTQKGDMKNKTSKGPGTE